MDLDRLAEFVAIAQHGSLKKAAFSLDLSVATLSARLIRFEEHLGTSLFIRTGQALELTPSGSQLLPQALEILSRVKQLRQDMLQVQAHSYHKLRIAVAGSSLPLHLGPFLDQLILKHPGMQLDLLDDSQFSIENGLTCGEVDIYFAPVGSENSPPHIVRHLVARSGEYVFLPRTHRLAERSTVSIRELDGECFILYPKTAETAIRDFQLMNLKDSGIRYTLYDSDTSVLFNKLLVPIGKGILLYTHIMDAPPNTVCVPVTGLPHHATICFFYHKANSNPDVQAFVKDYLAYTREVATYEHR